MIAKWPLYAAKIRSVAPMRLVWSMSAPPLYRGPMRSAYPWLHASIIIDNPSLISELTSILLLSFNSATASLTRPSRMCTRNSSVFQNHSRDSRDSTGAPLINITKHPTSQALYVKRVATRKCPLVVFRNIAQTNRTHTTFFATILGRHHDIKRLFPRLTIMNANVYSTEYQFSGGMCRFKILDMM